MTQLLLVGAGNLGSRHLQSLALLDRPAKICVVDPTEASRNTARSRFGEVAQKGEVTLELAASLDAAPSQVDVAVIATSANIRTEVVREVLAKHRPRYLILEKLLAQSVAELSVLSAEISRAGVPTWVNCPRRQWSVYQRLREELRGASSVGLSVSGSRWGLGSNAVHFLDLLAFLGGEDAYSAATSNMAPGSIPSARSGFVEVAGRLSFAAPKDRFVTMSSFPEGDAPLLLEVSSPTLHALVSEGTGQAIVRRAAEKWQPETWPVEVLYQSRLTNLSVQALLDRGTCDLTPFAASAQHHVPFLNALSAHLGVERCPVT